jgi:hypothetical protein
LANQDVTSEALASFVADYCLSQGREDALKYIPVFLQLLSMGQFDIVEAIKKYTEYSKKQFYSLILGDGRIIRQWIE